MKTLKDLFLAQVGNMYDAKRRIAKALQKPSGSDKIALCECGCNEDSENECADRQPANVRRGIRPAGMNRKREPALI